METKNHKPNSRPLVPGGTNYTAMHLVFQKDSIRVKPSFGCYFFAGLLVLPALFFVVPLVLLGDLSGGTDPVFVGIATALFCISVFLMYLAVRMIRRIRKQCRSLFDLVEGIFYPNGYDPHETGGENFPAIPFSELSSLQIVTEHCSTRKNSFDSYELNIVLRDGRRFNLMDHGNKECFAEEAEKLSETLSIPLTDAQGKRLSCDTFLALPSNIRENLLFGLFGFLFSALFFALGDGRAWYLTRQSFHWEKTPAVVESAKIRRHSGKRTTYSLDFQFRYRYRGKNYVSSDYDFFNMRSSEYALEKIVRRYPSGKKIPCYVNPRSPGQAVVDRHIPPIWEMMLNSLWTSCFLITGLFCTLRAAAQYRLLKKRGNRIQQKNMEGS